MKQSLEKFMDILRKLRQSAAIALDMINQYSL